MFSLTARAEEAFLGALLSGVVNPDKPRLTVADFSRTERGDLYRRILAARAAPSTGEEPTGGALVTAVANEPGEPRFTPSDLSRYQAACPNPDHAADYGRIVATEAFRRDVMRRAVEFSAALRGDPDGPAAEQIRRRRDGLYRQVRRDDLTTETFAPRRSFTYAALPPRPGPLALSPDPRVRREEQLLAGLLHDPGQTRAVASLLPAESFTDTRRQEIYRAILARAAAGDAVDEVLIAWQMEQQRDPAAFRIGDLPDRLKGHEVDLAYLRGLADTRDMGAPAWDLAVELSVEDFRALVLEARRPAGQEPAGTRRQLSVTPAVRGEPASPSRPVLDPGLSRPPDSAPAHGVRPQP